MPPQPRDDDSDFKPVTAADVTDLALLPGEFRAFANEMRSSIEQLVTRIYPALDEIKEGLIDMRLRVNQLERDQSRTDQRLAALEARALKKRKKKIS